MRRMAQADQTVLMARYVARQAAGVPPRILGRPGTDLVARVTPVKAPVGPVRNRRAGRLTPIQKSGDVNSRNHWNDSPYMTDPNMNDRRWDQTVTTS